MLKKDESTLDKQRQGTGRKNFWRPLCTNLLKGFEKKGSTEVARQHLLVNISSITIIWRQELNVPWQSYVLEGQNQWECENQWEVSDDRDQGVDNRRCYNIKAATFSLLNTGDIEETKLLGMCKQSMHVMTV